MQEAKAYICDEMIVLFSHYKAKSCFLWSKKRSDFTFMRENYIHLDSIGAEL
ncbi:MAG: hypothetical protein ACLUE8_14765 [Lachnospiraceae bacterium]